MIPIMSLLAIDFIVIVPASRVPLVGRHVDPAMSPSFSPSNQRVNACDFSHQEKIVIANRELNAIADRKEGDIKLISNVLKKATTRIQTVFSRSSVGSVQRTQSPAETVWRVISTPGNLELCHPFCASNPVHTWPGENGARLRASCRAENGKKFKRLATEPT